MRYMILVKANAESEASAMPTEELAAEMATFHEEMARAGVLVDASGLQASSKGWRVEIRGSERSIVDGPFAETKELIAGYTIIKVKDEQEARDWTRRFPNPTLGGADCHIEVRRVYELEDFGPLESIKRFRDIPGNGRPAV
jgi:hypothetical protein